MFTNISWGVFIGIFSAALIIYYIVIGTVYYRQELLAIILGKKNRIQPQVLSEAIQQPQPVMGNAVNDDTDYVARFRQAQQNITTERKTKDIEEQEAAGHTETALIGQAAVLTEGIATLFQIVEDAGATKENITSLFPSLLRQYPQIAESNYKAKISAHIYEVCNKQYNIGITEDEVNGLWNN